LKACVDLFDLCYICSINYQAKMIILIILMIIIKKLFIGQVLHYEES